MATTRTDWICLDEATLARRVDTFGLRVDFDALRWSTAHGDLHWANLTVPGCWLLDWEAWGEAAARLLTFARDSGDTAMAARLHAYTGRPRTDSALRDVL